MANLRTPLSVAKGRGSSGSGTEHFWHQRITAVALVPLVIWFCFSVAALPAMDHASITAWLSAPFNAILMIAAIIAIFFHASLGLQVVLEDYVSQHGIRTIAIIVVKLLCFLLAITGVFSVIKIALGS